MSDEQPLVEAILSKKKSTVDPEDIEKLLNLFKKFNIDNLWSKVKDANDFVCSRFDYGSVNDIICCQLTKNAIDYLQNEFKRKIEFPKIVIKFLSDDNWLEINRMDLAISNTICSEQGITPRLLYADDKCLVHQFLDGRNYSYEDDCDPNTVKKVALLLAKIHSISPVPISSFGWIQWQQVVDNPNENEFHKLIVIQRSFLIPMKNNEKFKELYYPIFVDIDFVGEFEFAQNLMDTIHSPLVFSHTDFNRNNRIVQIEEKTGEKTIYAIDLDYTNYNHRGVDLGRYFSNYKHHEDMFGNEGFPTDDEMDLFLDEYRSQVACRQSYKEMWLNDPINSMEHLKDETKIFCLNAYLIDSSFLLGMFMGQPTVEKLLIQAKDRWDGYLTLKQMFTNDGTINRVLSNKK